MAQGNWEADKMLDVYIYDYLMKRNLQETAKAFMAEGKVATDPVAIDAPGGFLFEWWSVFWDVFIVRTNEKHSNAAAAYFETQQMKAKELQLQQYQQLHRQAQLRRDAGRPALNGAISGMNSDALLGASAASPLAGHLKNMNSMDSEALLKSTTNFPGQLLQGSASLSPQNQGRNQQTTDIRPVQGVAHRSLPVDPSSLYGQGLVQGKPGLGGVAGFNQGASGSTLLTGLPVTGNEQLRSSLGQQVQRPFLSASNQHQVLSVQQQLLAQAQAQGSFGNSHSFGDMDPRRLRGFPKGGLNGKDGQPSGNDSSMASPMQPSSPMVRQDQAEYAMKFKPSHMQPSPSQQSQEQIHQQHQLQQNNRKRKPTSSGAANSTGTGNTVGPANSQPSTPSTNTAGDGVAMPGNVSHASGIPKSSMIYGVDGASGLAPSSNQLDDLEQFGDIGSLDDNVDSFLANDGDARDIFAPLQISSLEHNAEASKGPFSDIGCNRTSNNKILCCHFSSDAKLLASAGHEKKVLIWNMGNLQTESTPEEHAHVITDIRFRPESTQLATSSFDRTVRLWNAAEPSCSLQTFSGHSSQVTSLDFHPNKTDLLCSCDDIGEIRLWSINQRSGSPFVKVGSQHQHMRFQPRIGQLLAAATENVILVFDFETRRKTHALQGHNKSVQSVCWDQNGDYLASVSQNSVKVWSLASGEPIHELNSNANNFHSCVFHPTHSGLLILGGYQTLQLWNMRENKTEAIIAHEGLISSLAYSATGIIASVSHDSSVKLWNINPGIQKGNA